MEEVKKEAYVYAVEHGREDGLTNCSPIYRNGQFPETLVDNFANPVNSLFEAFERKCEETPEAKCIGTQVLDSEGKKGYSWLTYKEWRARILRTTRLLVKLGIGTGANKFVAMVSTLSKEWLLLDMALIRVSAISVPFYRFLGVPEVRSIL